MKRRVKIKLSSLRPSPSKIEQMFNTARGRGKVVINHGESKIVMMPAETYEAMQREIQDLQNQIANSLAITAEDPKSAYTEEFQSSRNRSEGDKLPR